MSLIADRMGALGSENAFKLGDNIAECQAMGLDVIKFNLGEPDFDTAQHICESAAQNLRQGNTHYCPPHGIASFRNAIAKQVSESRGIEIDPELVCVTTGAKPPISYSVQTYVNPGDEVIIPAPYWLLNGPKSFPLTGTVTRTTSDPCAWARSIMRCRLKR